MVVGNLLRLVEVFVLRFATVVGAGCCVVWFGLVNVVVAIALGVVSDFVLLGWFL